MLTLFYLMAAIAVLASLGMLTLRHPLHSAMCLITVMVMIAGIFAMLDAHFLAAVQIIVYAGAVMVLVVFVIMLLSLEGEEREPIKILPLLLSAALASAFLLLVAPLLMEDFAGKKFSAITGDVAAIGEILFTRYVYPFEAASFLIIAAILGAVMLGRRAPAKDNLEAK